ncbi:MAG: isopropylmalate isomerase [Yoonia sp.]|nr:isopropylmalate isomerase [Yoonia sp.]
MKPVFHPVFDMDDRARLPWRFYGAACTILARG